MAFVLAGGGPVNSNVRLPRCNARISSPVGPSDFATRVSTPNVRQAVPFFNVKDIEASLRFYVDGLGFTITRRWEPEGRIRWCWLERDQVAVMLQEYRKDGS